MKTVIANLPLHGRKDGYPYKINPEHYEVTIEILRNAISEAKIGSNGKLNAIRWLNDFIAN